MTLTPPPSRPDRPFDPGCIFCRIIARQAPAKIRYESDDVIAFDDRRPQAPTHVLICPKAHYPTFIDTPPDVLVQMNAQIKAVADVLGFLDRGFRLIVNNGPESGQIVYHLHYHFLAGRQMGGF
ncbi:MAG: HIT domain-containing protein [Candidatus Zixiibacteriota bacterium]